MKPQVLNKWIAVVSLTAVLPFPAYALSDKIYEELDMFSRIIEIVDKQYVESVDEHELIAGAIDGMLFSLDPHTVYLPPDMYRDFKSDTHGQFGGVGIEITVKDGVLTVVAPIEGSPAYKAGIRSGDRILKINGESTKGMTLVDAVHKMRGPSGKKVGLTILRENVGKAMEFTVVREIIKMEAVKSEEIPGGYGYFRIVSFQEKTAVSLEKSLKEMEQKSGKLKGMILDLRDNPGGLLSEAIDVADIFLEKGTIVSTRGRDAQTEVRHARKSSAYEGIPMVVLINRGSASASEIVAGALQDLKRARLLGATSFGKGSVQTLVDLGNNAALKITIAKYYTPRGRSIDGKGIVPDISLDSSEYKKDVPKKEGEKGPTIEEYQKKKAIAILKGMGS